MQHNGESCIAVAVEQAEQKTEAQIVVVAAHASSDYFEADLLVGAITSFLFLASAIYIPAHVSLNMLPFEFLFGFALGTFISRRIPKLRRLLLSTIRIQKAVSRRARATFVTYKISNTQKRIGVLIYASLFENRVQIIPDLGIESVIARSQLDTLEESYRMETSHTPYEEALVNLTSRLGTLLSQKFPPLKKQMNELSNETIYVEDT